MLAHAIHIYRYLGLAQRLTFLSFLRGIHSSHHVSTLIRFRAIHLAGHCLIALITCYFLIGLIFSNLATHYRSQVLPLPYPIILGSSLGHGRLLALLDLVARIVLNITILGIDEAQIVSYIFQGPLASHQVINLDIWFGRHLVSCFRDVIELVL